MAGEQQTLRDFLTAQARRFGKKPFLAWRGREYSFRDIDDQTDRIATGLFRSGYRAGDRIGLLLSDRPELIFCLLGAPKLGMIPVAIDPLRSPQVVRDALTRSGCAGVITESQLGGAANLSFDEISDWRGSIAIDGTAEKDRMFREHCDGAVIGFWPDLRAVDTAAIFFTGGKSSPPMPVELSHQNLLTNCHQMIQPFRLNETDRVWSAASLSRSVTFVTQVLASLACGAMCVLKEQAASESPADELSLGCVSVVEGTPELFERLAREGRHGDRDLSALRLALCARGPIDSSLSERFEDTYDTLLVEGYGLVEACGLSCANPYTGVRKAGSIGIPLPGQECRVVDGREYERGPGEVGQILVRGPNVMRGYYNDPRATARVLKDGWLFTGDSGYVDADGYYFLSPAPH